MTVTDDDAEAAMDMDTAQRQPRKFKIDEQPGKGKAAVCKSCREAFSRGCLRAVPSEKKSKRNAWFLHLDCIDGGVHPNDTFYTQTRLSEESMTMITSSYGAKIQLGTPAADAADDAQDVAMPPSSAAAPALAPAPPAAQQFEENILRHMEYWHDVDAAAAVRGYSVRTWEGAHPALEA